MNKQSSEKTTTVKLAVSIKEELEKLRLDPKIREFINNARQFLREGLSTKHPDQLPPKYEQTIHEALQYLANQHIKRYFSAQKINQDKKSVIILSYSSLLKRPDRRVMELKAVCLSKEDEKFCKHITETIRNKWIIPISKNPNRLEIHQLAQSPIVPESGVPIRIPIYISAFDLDWSNTNFEEREHFIYKNNNGKDPVGTYLFNSSLNKNIAEYVDDLKKFTGHLVSKQSDLEEKYPSEELSDQDYQAYVRYLQELLFYDDKAGLIPLCLCTIAISDDLSNIPLGSAMVFTEDLISPDITKGIQDLCLMFSMPFSRLSPKLIIVSKQLWFWLTGLIMKQKAGLLLSETVRKN